MVLRGAFVEVIEEVTLLKAFVRFSCDCGREQQRLNEKPFIDLPIFLLESSVMFVYSLNFYSVSRM